MQNRNREQALVNDGRMNGYADEGISSNRAIRLSENYFAYNPSLSTSAGGGFSIANAGEIGLRFNEGVTDEDRKRFAIADESNVAWITRQIVNWQKSILSATSDLAGSIIRGTVETSDAVSREIDRWGRRNFGDKFDAYYIPLERVASVIFDSLPGGEFRRAMRGVNGGLHELESWGRSNFGNEFDDYFIYLNDVRSFTENPARVVGGYLGDFSEFIAVPEDEKNLMTELVYYGVQGAEIGGLLYVAPTTLSGLLLGGVIGGAQSVDSMARQLESAPISQEEKDHAMFLAGSVGAVTNVLDPSHLVARGLGGVKNIYGKAVTEYLLNSLSGTAISTVQEYINANIIANATNSDVKFNAIDVFEQQLIANLGMNAGRFGVRRFLPPKTQARIPNQSNSGEVAARHTDSWTLLNGISSTSSESVVVHAEPASNSASTGVADSVQSNQQNSVLPRRHSRDSAAGTDVVNGLVRDDARSNQQLDQTRAQEVHQETNAQIETQSEVQAEQVVRHEGDDSLRAGDDANVLSDDVQRVQEIQELQEPSDVIEVDAVRVNESNGEVNHVEGSERSHRAPEDKPVETQVQESQGENRLTRRVRDAVDLVKRFNPLQRVDALLRMNRRERRIMVAQEQGRKFDALHEAAVRARDDESSDQKAWLDELVAERGGEFIYIDKDALEASGVREQVEQVFPLDVEQMQRQSEHGLNIPIMMNLGSYIRDFAHTDAARGLADHLRFSADSDSRAQARALRENAQDLLAADLFSIDEFWRYGRDRQQAAERVYADILGHLDGFKGLNESQRTTAAKLMSSFYVRLAQRSSGDSKIWDFYERNSLFGDDSAQRLTDFESELIALTSQGNGKVDVAGVVDATGRAFLSLYTRAAYDTRSGSLGSIKQDVQVLLDYMGVKDIDAWQSMSNEQRVVYENKFLDAFGVYLREGRAHSPGLLRPFRLLKAWLKDVFYSRFAGNDLPGEVREVLERMFYSDDLLQMQYREAELDAFVRAARRAGVDVGLAEYALHLGADARDSAAEIVQNALWRDEQLMLRLQSEPGFQTERGTLMNELQSELSQLPVFEVIDLLTRKEGGVKFSAAALEALLGVDGKADFNSLKERGMVADVGGVSPEVLADEQGASSAHEFVREVLHTKPLDEVVPALADAMLKAEYGQVSTPEKIQQVAQEALFNSLPYDALDAAELGVLEQLSGVKGQSSAYLGEQAQAMVSGVDIGMIDSAYFRNEMRDANRAASHALDVKDYVAAIRLYDKARLLRRVMQEVLTARRQTDEQLKAINVWISDGTIESQTRGVIQDLVVQYGLVRKNSRRSNHMFWGQAKKSGGRRAVVRSRPLKRWVAAMQRLGVEVGISEVDFAALDNKVVTAMTQEQLTRVYEMIEQIALAGRRVHEAHPGKKVLRINAVRNKRPQRRIRGNK